MNSKLKLFYKGIQRKNFSKEISTRDYMYHHNFLPSYIPDKNFANMFLLTFDSIRLYFYIISLVAIGTKLPFYLLMRRKNYVSNPDYMIDMKIKN